MHIKVMKDKHMAEGTVVVVMAPKQYEDFAKKARMKAKIKAKLEKEQKDIAPDINEAINKNFWDLI